MELRALKVVTRKSEVDLRHSGDVKRSPLIASSESHEVKTIAFLTKLFPASRIFARPIPKILSRPLLVEQ
jgi:hypothetical protein